MRRPSFQTIRETLGYVATIAAALLWLTENVQKNEVQAEKREVEAVGLASDESRQALMALFVETHLELEQCRKQLE